MPLVVIKNYLPGMLHQEVYKKRIKITYAGLVIGQKQKLSHYFGKNLTIGLLFVLFLYIYYKQLWFMLNMWFLNKHCNKKRMGGSTQKSLSTFE